MQGKGICTELYVQNIVYSDTGNGVLRRVYDRKYPPGGWELGGLFVDTAFFAWIVVKTPLVYGWL